MYEIDCPAHRRRKGGDSRSGERSSAARRSKPPRPGLRSGATSSAKEGCARGSEKPLALVRARCRLEQAPRPAVQGAEVEAALLGALDDPAGGRDPALPDWPMSARLVRSVREAPMGWGTPSTQTRVGLPPPRSSPRIGSSA